jgi:hypothetical protein
LNSSATNAAIAIHNASGVFNARLPTLTSASITSATTAHFTPSNAAITSGCVPYTT